MRVLPAAVLAVVALTPFLANPYWTLVASFALIWGLIILSLSLLAGWSGEVSIAAAAYLGIGAIVASRLGDLPLPVTLLAAVAAGIPVSILIGLPALRLRGLSLTVATLAFMLGMQDAVFPRIIGRQSNIPVERPTLFGLSVADDRIFYLVVLGIAVVVAALSLQVGRSPLRRRFVALDEDPLAFASLGGGPLAHKLTAFVLSGMVATLAGALWGMLNRQLSGGILTVGQSILFLAMAIVAGRGSVLAAFIGGAVFVVVPEVYRSIPAVTQYTLLLSGLGMALLLLQYPGGLASAPQVLGAMLGRLRRSRPTDSEPDAEPDRPAGVADLRTALGPARGGSTPVTAGGPAAGSLLRVEQLTVTFGGVTALQHVDLEVAPGSIVGLIGPNGAGKTTLMNAVSGFVRPQSGRILYGGRDLAGSSVVERARSGIARTFQTPKIFPSLTVEENVLLGMTLGRRGWVGELTTAALRSASADERERAALLLRLVGLERLAGRSAGTIPHGAARRLEVARSLAGRPSLLLLDEPVAGLDERESDAFGELVTLVQHELDLAVLVVEHDVRWVQRICGQLSVLDFGRLLAHGPTVAVLADKRVAEAYLGREWSDPALDPAPAHGPELTGRA